MASRSTAAPDRSTMEPLTQPNQPAPHRRETPARIALIGVHGFGAHHLKNLDRLARAGAVELVAVADPNPPSPGALPDSTAVHPDLQSLLAGNHSPDVVIVATPIQTHAPLALATLASGADLYLEKPPVASLADFRQLQEAAGASGRSVQIGFQSLGSQALAAIDKLLRDGTIGTLQGIGATGRWVRDRAYYKRSRWAGKRSLDGVDVVDGVATNPLAHAIATALRIAGARTVEDIASVETDLYRANDIEADDTSVIRIRTAAGLPITCALTLCASESVEPYITLQGSTGTAVFHYTEDRLHISNADGEHSQEFGRDDLTENLLEHLATGRELTSALNDSGAFMLVLEAVRTAEPPAPVSPAHVLWRGDGDAAHAVIPGIEDALERAVSAHATFKELALPWARPADPAEAGTLFTAGGRPLAVLRTGAALNAALSPRPYLHPVTTPGGTVVTDHLPADHPWHLGAGFALQDVSGTNFWGGKTYTREAGEYVSRQDHGRIELLPATPDEPDTRRLRWLGTDGQPLLTEQRTLSHEILGGRAWRLDLETELTAVVDVSLGSPGSNGAAGSGYGGFFWRLPACSGARIFTSDAEGEPAVHGAVAPWLAWTASFGEVPGIRLGQPATLVFKAPAEAADPWFVRCSGYPGVGSALAWDRPVALAAGESLRRSLSVWVCDGELSPAAVGSLLSQR
jgi:predicted dehydrogenase